MILNVFFIVFIVKLSRCSLVLDSMSQNTLYVSSYCPEMKGCIEGTHVICQYYNHRNAFGHLCNNYVKVSITPEMVHKILDGVNKIRMNLATGKETGKDGHLLPRAYGMMRMHWDSELATLAQLFADQCLGLKEDECRATEKFSNPSQFITLINFKSPNWEYLSHNNTERGLNQEKISSSIGKALKSLHGIKNLITTDDINECPLLETLPNKGSRSYLKLIRGRATHIGCGISAYKRSQTISNRSQRIYNTIQLVCNVSDGPQQAQPVYTTDPPIPDTGFTEKCGCPEGYRDSMGCLCEEYSHNNVENSENQWQQQQQFEHLNKYEVRARIHSHEAEPCDDPSGICDVKPNTVMLPIFEILDAPIEPMNSYESDNEAEMQFHTRFGNASFIPTSMEEKEFINDEVFPEAQNEFTKHHNHNSRHRDFHRGISKEYHEKEIKTHDNVEISYERTAEHLNHGYSMEDNVVDHELRDNSDYDDRIAANDASKEHIEDENTFLKILDRLERAVKNVELEGHKRDVVDFKMRKIYEAALKSKRQHVKIDDNELDKLEELKKVTDYLTHKSDAVFGDKIAHNDKEESMFNNMDRQDKESDVLDKLFNILNKKRESGHYDHKNDYRNKHTDTIGHDENNVYAKYPSSRNQKRIDRYNNNLREFNKGKSGLLSDFHHSDTKNMGRMKIADDRPTKVLGSKRKMRNFDMDQPVRRKYSHPEHNVYKKQYAKPLGYRRVFEMENERPTLPTTTQTHEKIKLEIHIEDEINHT